MRIVRAMLVPWSACLLALLPAAAASAAGSSSRSQGVLVAYDLSSGVERWRVLTPGTFDLEDVSTDVLVGRGFSCESGPFQTLAFRAGSGDEVWHRPAGPDGPSVEGATSLATGSAVAGVALSQGLKTLKGVDVASGDARWSTTVRRGGSVAANAKTVVLASASGAVRGLDRRSGRQLWDIPAPKTDRHVQVEIDNTSLVLMTYARVSSSSHAEVLDPRTGVVRWETDGGAIPAGPVVVVNQADGSGSNAVTARDARAGTPLWSQDVTIASILPMASRVGFITATGLDVVDARTGQQTWALARPDLAAQQPLLAGADRQSVAFVDGQTVTILDAASGTPSTPPITLPTGYETVNTFTVAAGTLYVGLGCAANGD
jgi:outer membrane protein assembly factor BamB